MTAPAPGHPAPPDDSDSWFARWKLLLLLGVFVVIAFPGVVFGTHSFFYRDYGVFAYPLAQYHRECFWRGEIPLWNPLNDCGLPFAAQWNTLVFYPGSLIYLLLPQPASLNWFCLAHLFLAAAGMYALAHRWTGHRFAASMAGLAFAWNGLTLHSLMWPNNIAALGWMPWVVLASERGGREGGTAIVVAALAGAMQMLSGAPEIILLTWLSVGVFWLAELWKTGQPRTRVLLRLAAIAMLVAALAAVQLLPFVDLLRHSQRDASFGGTLWAMPLWGWANFVVPLFGCTPSVVGVYSQVPQQWTSSYYVGIATVALALLAIRQRSLYAKLLAGLALAGLVLSLGEVNAGLKKILPMLGFIRFPIKFVVLTTFALPLLAAFGFVRWEHCLPDFAAARRALLRIGVGLSLAVLLIMASAHLIPILGSSAITTVESGITRLIFLALAMVCLALARQQTDRAKRRVWLCALLVILGGDALTHAPRQNPVVPGAAYAALRLEINPVPKAGESRAMISPPMQRLLQGAATTNPHSLYLGYRRALLGDCNLVDQIPKVNGFYSLYLREAEEVLGRLYARTNPPAPIMDFLGVSQLSDPETLFLWHARTNFMSVVTIGQQPVFAGPGQTLDAILSPEFDPKRIVFLPDEAKHRVVGAGDPDARVRSCAFRPQRITAEIESSRATMVVVAQAFYHPWKAFVDGKTEPIWRANHAFGAIAVPAGRHELTMVYADSMFRAGAAISMMALITCGVMFVVLRARRGSRGVGPRTS